MAQKVLIICDDEDKVKELTKVLKSSGIDFLSTANGVLGLEEVEHFKPELVVVGLILSSDGGLMVLEKLKAAQKSRPMSIVIMMAMDTDDYMEKVNSLGVDAFITKPYETKVILEEVKRILRKEKRAAKKIMVIDDDPTLVKILDIRLTANGYLVIPLTDSELAINTVKKERPDLVITDIMMPEVSGWKIAQDLKSNKEFKDIPIIILSAIIEKEGKPEKFEVGDFFMAKPVMMDKLLAKIEELLKV